MTIPHKLKNSNLDPSSLPFTNDVFVKFALTGEDDDTKYLRKKLIQYFTGISPMDTIVMNPDLLPSNFQNKDMILDIKSIDDKNRYFNFEIQVSSLYKLHDQRFQVYHRRSLSLQLQPGDSYDKLEPVYQIVLVTSSPKDKDCLFEIYTLKNDKGQQHPHNLIYIIYVYMTNINQVIKQKDIKEMEVAEKFVYILENNLDDAILKEGSRVVKIMEKKKEMFLADTELSYAAFQRQVMHWVNEHESDAIREEGLIEGKKLGIEVGKKEAYTAYFKARFQEDISEYLSTLDSNKWEILENNIYLVNSIEELKELLKYILDKNYVLTM